MRRFMCASWAITPRAMLSTSAVPAHALDVETASPGMSPTDISARARNAPTGRELALESPGNDERRRRGLRRADPIWSAVRVSVPTSGVLFCVILVIWDLIRRRRRPTAGAGAGAGPAVAVG